MTQVSHRANKAKAKPAVTVAQVLQRGYRRLARARLHYGHGTDNAADDAAALLAHAIGRPDPIDVATLRRRVTNGQQLTYQALLQRRIRERIPAVYMTQRCCFAGLPMYVDQRVLIPRSPIAELIEQRFRPWMTRPVQTILDLGTGSGCIAVACARAFPAARVDAADISLAALQVARINIRRYRLSRRVSAVQSDHFAGLEGRSYDIIVSNPPYVGRRELKALPPEYRHEPRGALEAGGDGLASVRIILRDAPAHLRPGGVLIVEVGNSEAAVRRAFPRLPFLWLSFERGGGGVFLLEREQLLRRRSKSVSNVRQ